MKRSDWGTRDELKIKNSGLLRFARNDEKMSESGFAGFLDY
jgi:hypothetical protein